MDMLTPLEQAAAPAFDYDTMPAEIVPRQQERAERIRGMYRQTVETAGEIGRELLAAQSEMDHGQFLPWVTGAAGLSKSTAYRCMDMARSFGPKLPIVGSLPLAVVHKLAEKSTPEPVRAAVLRRIEAGETIQPEAILDEVREARTEARKEAETQREEARRAKLSPEQRAVEDAKNRRKRRTQEVEEREREERRNAERQERQAKAVKATEAAGIIIASLGAEQSAAFCARYSRLQYEVFRKLEDLAHIERARGVEPVMVRKSDIAHVGPITYGAAWWEDEDEVKQLAEEIRRDGLKEPIVLAEHTEQDRRHRYRVVDGSKRFRALTVILQQDQIAARISPPIASNG